MAPAIRLSPGIPLTGVVHLCLAGQPIEYSIALADASRTYTIQIESGIDNRTGRWIEPSPGILRKLADTLAGGEADEANRIYQFALDLLIPGAAAVESPTHPLAVGRVLVFAYHCSPRRAIRSSTLCGG